MQRFNDRLSFRSKAALLLALPLAALAGCQATVNTRWATTEDSAQAWQSAMTHIPIHIHGATLGDGTAETASPTNGGATSFDATRAGQASLAQSRRIELYVDAHKLPADDSFCAVEPTLQAARGAPDGVVVGALCDGPRLVATETVHLGSADLASAQMPQAIERLKSKLLDGLATDPRLAPYQYEY